MCNALLSYFLAWKNVNTYKDRTDLRAPIPPHRPQELRTHGDGCVSVVSPRPARESLKVSLKILGPIPDRVPVNLGASVQESVFSPYIPPKDSHRWRGWGSPRGRWGPAHLSSVLHFLSQHLHPKVDIVSCSDASTPCVRKVPDTQQMPIKHPMSSLPASLWLVSKPGG